MKILLTNDDGYKSNNILILYKELIKHHEVYICAPLYERSGSSNSITLFDKMEYREIDGGYAIDGTPTDCVKVALNGFYKNVTFDLVISGINYGVNMCNDIVYSGTIGAAKEGVINSINSIACSIESKNYLSNRYIKNFLTAML